MERLDSFDGSGNDSNRWRDKEIILLNEWIPLRGTPYAFEYLPDDFDRSYILSDKETFDDASRFEKLQKDNWGKIVNYFMNIKDKIKLEELRFY